MQISPDLKAALAATSTPTLGAILLKRGYANCWVRGAKPLAADQPRLVGPAFTLRFVPARPDLVDPASPSFVNIRVAIEEMPEGSIAVIDAMGCTHGGTVGDIMTLRMAIKQVAGLVTDGAIRDISGVRRSGLPVWSAGTAAPPAAVGLAFAGWSETISCGGVAVLPGDILVADEDGVIVVPAAIAEAVAAEAREADRLEEWVTKEVAKGASLPGLYPPNAANLARYRDEA